MDMLSENPSSRLCKDQKHDAKEAVKALMVA